MEKRLFFSVAYDFYKLLLTERQMIVFEMYHLNDFSLNEISEELNVSRQAVNDLLKRTENNILDYEDKLRLFENHNKRKKQSESICAILAELSKSGMVQPEHADELVKMVKKIADTDDCS